MILITSGSFISNEFQVELGEIPPSFLPIGNRRLYEYQISQLKSSFPDEDIFISITDAFKISSNDYLRLKDLNVEIIYVPNELTLGESLLFSINSIGRYDECIRILHGDTFIKDFPYTEDIVGLAKAEDGYTWEFQNDEFTENTIWCGFFAFSNIKLLAKNLTAQRGQFVSAIRAYQAQRSLVFTSIENWQDLGHINTYFRSRANFTTQRAFNRLTIKDSTVRKSSDQVNKIKAEAMWLHNIPPQLKRFLPQVIQTGYEEGQFFYEIEFLPHLPLNELFVLGNLPLTFWKKIFKLTNEMLVLFSEKNIKISDLDIKSIESDFYKLVVEKTFERLNTYISIAGCDISCPTFFNGKKLPSLSNIIEECQSSSLSIPSRPGILHGDLCFSNILYDSRANSLKIFDPRGLNAELKPTIYGDLRYDIAKYAHSVIGLYDHIISGHYVLHESKPLNFEMTFQIEDNIYEIQKEFFSNFKLLGLAGKEILPLVVLLFISMLPLHCDQPLRQRALLANALRIYTLWRFN